MKRYLLIAAMLVLSWVQLQAQNKEFKPGEIWFDVNNQPINAHGGGFLLYNGTYYWYGELKKGKTTRVPDPSWENFRVEAGGVSCYSSKDLLNWKYEGVALSSNTKDSSSELHASKVIERPKVIYNSKTKKFVMWLHLDSRDYAAARSGVAISDRPEGPFTFIRSERPNGNMARDMTIYQDDDGKAYHFYSSENNATMHVCLLSDDYLSHTSKDKRILIDQSREAPAVFKYHNKYYLISSACTGWAPNAASYAVADSILGEWKQFGNPCMGENAGKTFFSQSTYVLPVDAANGRFIFLADRWNKNNLEDSRYIWLPLQMNETNVPEITWYQSWNLSLLRQSPSHSFSLGDSSFLLDGKPFQMISGEIHYPRVPREAWRQRMKMAKAMGLNTIGTYVFWNLHEPQKGVYDFSGNNDIAAFVKMAQEEGLWVVLRPSPYVCAEWEFGGYPYWLQNENGLTVRSKETAYINAYKKYISEVGKQLASLQVNHGGNILMVQIENEYGSYGSDKAYLELNKQLFVEAGFDGLLYTCDPAPDIAKGHLPGLLPAVNGIDNPAQVKRLVRANHDGKGPFFIAEWYPAWFDWWGTRHHTVAAEKYVGRLDSVLAAGISINMYMFHGGTTRGFMNGANCKETTPYEPQISSYDYDAPVDEAGNATKKFMLFRETIQKHLPANVKLPDIPAAKETITIDDITFTQANSLFDILPKAVVNRGTLSFEDLHQPYGYVLYRTRLTAHPKTNVVIKGLRDYAIIMVDGKKIGVLDRRLNQESIEVAASGKVQTLDILVENMGRINFGPYLLTNKKGIIDHVEISGRKLENWQMFGLPFEAPGKTKLERNKKLVDGIPAIKKGSFHLEKTGDTYLDMSKWGKGVVWVNGHNLGRYWDIGPQQTIYVPAEWLVKGQNEIIIFELLKPFETTLKGIAKPVLDQL